MDNRNKILLTQIYAGGGIGSEFLYRHPTEYRTQLISTYPEIEKWAKKEIFNKVEEWPDDVDIRISGDDLNLVGRFLAANIETPSHVIDNPLNPEILISELEKEPYTHVGFSVISNDFRNFIECAKLVKKFDFFL